MTPEQKNALIGMGDCFSHYHSEDRTPTADFLHGLQGVAKVVTLSASSSVSIEQDITLVDTSSADVSAQLPKSRNGRELTFIKLSNLHTMTLTAYSGETIDGASSVSYTTKNLSRTLKAVTGGWEIVSGNVWDKNPYGSFSSTQNQAVSTINTPTLVTLNTTDYAYLMSRVSGDGIHVDQAGLYNFQFSVQFTNSDTQAHDAALWIRKNGSDLTMTNSVTSITGTHGGQPGYHVMSANFFVSMAVGDYVEMWWSTNSTQVTLQTLPAITTPFVAPGAPSVVVTMSYASSEV